MDYNAYIPFVLAAIALAIVPGPTVTVIIANSLKHAPEQGF